MLELVRDGQGHVQVVDHQARLLAQMAAHWFRAYREQHGFPDNYIALDLETSGLSPTRNLICMAGYAIVERRRIVDIREFTLNWTRHPEVDQLQLIRDLHDVEQAMRRGGKAFHHTYSRLKTGLDPYYVLNELVELLDGAEQRNEIVVAHNGWAFDAEFLQASFHNYLHDGWIFRDNGLYDSGVAEKASQLDDGDEPLPGQSETLREWARRIGQLRRRGIFWALDSHCESRYGVYRTAGLELAQAHLPSSDVQALHRLVEAHRDLAEALGV